ncbi:Hypothetical predicted protein, partial [Scomber scombrus]
SQDQITYNSSQCWMRGKKQSIGFLLAPFDNNRPSLWIVGIGGGFSATDIGKGSNALPAVRPVSIGVGIAGVVSPPVFDNLLAKRRVELVHPIGE